MDDSAAPYSAPSDSEDSMEVVASNSEMQQVELESLVVRHDHEFYFEDGDCVIQVENVLFKVHRLMLSQDNSAFRDMFVVASRPSVDEMDKPLVLPQDSAEQFASLLGVLYALPDFIEKMCNPINIDDVEYLLKIAEISNKYHFLRIESWACDILSKTLASLWEIPEYPVSKLLDISILCQHENLRSLIVEHWVSHLSSRRAILGPGGSRQSPSCAILAADRHNIRSLQATAYYAQIMRMDLRNTTGTLHQGSPLSQEQYICLLRGYWWLSHRSPRLIENPPSYEHSPACKSGKRQSKCKAKWGLRWPGIYSVNSSDHHPIDILSRLKESLSNMKADDASSSGWECWAEMKQGAADFVDNFPFEFLDNAILVDQTGCRLNTKSG